MNFSHVFAITYHPKFKFTHFAFILSLILKRPSIPMGPVDQMFQHSSIHWGLITPSDHETNSMKNWNFEINLNLLKKTRYRFPSFPLMLVVLTIMRGILGTQYRVFANCEETPQVRTKSDKISKTEIVFC